MFLKCGLLRCCWPKACEGKRDTWRLEASGGLAPPAHRLGHPDKVVTPKMRLDGDMGPNMGTTINKIACVTNGRKLNSASNIYSSSHFRTSVRNSAPPYLRTTKRGAEVRSAVKYSNAEVTGTERLHFKSVPPHLRHVGKDEILSLYLRT
ncbi:hypothetical protein E2C01_030663 [Portunus trituberculatus]|uniref:Uncharacterized protein n=1 Tax=Portunus trituberculatus TaxID=210409 RepID=A0A5B7EVY5_PORTR|nr:hypothetical protein [Portunus trituberculatus]